MGDSLLSQLPMLTLFYAYDPRCKTTKTLLEAIVTGIVHQSRVCGLVSLTNGIVWTSTL